MKKNATDEPATAEQVLSMLEDGWLLRTWTGSRFRAWFVHEACGASKANVPAAVVGALLRRGLLRVDAQDGQCTDYVGVR